MLTKTTSFFTLFVLAYLFLPSGKTNYLHCYGTSQCLASSDDNNSDYSDNFTTLPLDTFLVNLDGSQHVSYLEITFVLSVSSESLKKEIDEKLPLLRDSIINYLSTQTYDLALSRMGKKIIKERVKQLLNSYLTTGHVKEVFITKFLVQ